MAFEVLSWFLHAFLRVLFNQNRAFLSRNITAENQAGRAIFGS